MFPVMMLLNQKSNNRTKLKQRENGYLKCCRTCLSTKGLKYIFSASESMNRIKKYLKLTTGLEVKQNDGLSQKICIRCLKLLKMAVHFRYTTHKAYNFLLKLKKIKSEKNIEEERKTCWIEVKPLETFQSTIKLEDFGNNDIIDNDTLDNSVKIDNNDTINNGNGFSDSEDDFLLNKSNVAKDSEQTKQPKKVRPWLKIPVANVYKCNICEKEFTHRASYRAHVKNHTEFIVCELCGKQFRNAAVLKSHKGAIHGFEKMYKCDECDYRSSYAEALRIHQRLHTGEKPFQCDHCGDSFHRRRILIQHLARHTTRDSNLKCPLCPKTFRTANQLHGHKYVVHRKKLYRYGCTICERTYNRSYLVRKHARKDHKVEIGPVRKIPIETNN